LPSLVCPGTFVPSTGRPALPPPPLRVCSARTPAIFSCSVHEPHDAPIPTYITLSSLVHSLRNPPPSLPSVPLDHALVDLPPREGTFVPSIPVASQLPPIALQINTSPPHPSDSVHPFHTSNHISVRRLSRFPPPIPSAFSRFLSSSVRAQSLLPMCDAQLSGFDPSVPAPNLLTPRVPRDRLRRHPVTLTPLRDSPPRSSYTVWPSPQELRTLFALIC